VDVVTDESEFVDQATDAIDGESEREALQAR
jgi:hypothetical protein